MLAILTYIIPLFTLTLNLSIGVLLLSVVTVCWMIFYSVVIINLLLMNIKYLEEDNLKLLKEDLTSVNPNFVINLLSQVAIIMVLFLLGNVVIPLIYILLLLLFCGYMLFILENLKNNT